jgi:hypothetical protein
MSRASVPAALQERAQNVRGTLLPRLLPNSIASDGTRKDEERFRTGKALDFRDLRGHIDTDQHNRGRITKPLYCRAVLTRHTFGTSFAAYRGSRRIIFTASRKGSSRRWLPAGQARQAHREDGCKASVAHACRARSVRWIALRPCPLEPRPPRHSTGCSATLDFSGSGNSARRGLSAVPWRLGRRDRGHADTMTKPARHRL